jgi:von Willebrand factor type A domain
MKAPALRRGLAAAFALALVACGGGLKLVHINSSARKPSNVAVYFTVDTWGGQPVPGLTAEKFSIYEDGLKVSEFESKQTILNPKVAAAHYTLLLIDMSGSIVASNHFDDVVAAATQFTERVEKYQKVAVYAFDGSPDIYPIVPFTESEAAATGGVEGLKSFRPRDPSTNLNGAVVAALKALKQSLDHEPKSLHFGTLVVFTDGTDRAARVSKDDLDKALDAPEYAGFDIFAIGVGAEMNDSHLEDIGRTGTVKETDQANLGRAFDQISSKIEGMTARYYLLSYCTPSRAGKHEVTIEAHADKSLWGSLTYTFIADGFGPFCDPNSPPNFDVGHPVVAPPVEEPKEVEVKVEKKEAPHKVVAPKPHVTVKVVAPPPPAATATLTVKPVAVPSPPPPAEPPPAPPATEQFAP